MENFLRIRYNKKILSEATQRLEWITGDMGGKAPNSKRRVVRPLVLNELIVRVIDLPMHNLTHSSQVPPIFITDSNHTRTLAIGFLHLALLIRPYFQVNFSACNL